jgi:hypothetical protein
MYFRPKILTNEAMPISSVFTIFLHLAYVLLGEVKITADNLSLVFCVCRGEVNIFSFYYYLIL